MANYIGGSLPFGGGGAGLFSGFGGSAQQSMANLGSNYQSAYNSALDMNRTNYGNILSGYQQTLGQNADARAAVGSGYDSLLQDVLGGIGSMGQSRQRDINTNYTARSGQAAQQLIDRGLGNSTVQQSVQRGIGYDQARASNDLAEQIATTQAGFRSSIGQAGLNYRGQAIQQNDADAQAQLQWMNSVNAQYPDAGMYSQLAQQFGAANQQEQDRNRILAGAGSHGPPSAAGGYVPSGGGFAPRQNGADAGFSQPGYPVPGAPKGANNMLGFAPDANVVGLGSSAYQAAAGAGEGMAGLFPQYAGGDAGQIAGGAGGGMADAFGGYGWAGGNPGYQDMPQFPQNYESYA